MLDEYLFSVARQYTFESNKRFRQSNFANFVRHDVANEAKRRISFLPFELTVKASVGAGNWAAVPWLAFFDPLITRTATKGFYIVYLIDPYSESVVLSLNQGTTAVYKEFKEKAGREILRRRATDIRARVADFGRHFDSSEISLSSNESLPLGYEAGHAFGRTYHWPTYEKETFYDDLEKMLAAYDALVERGGTTPTETMMEDAGTSDIEETRKYFLSRRIERAPSVRRRVLEIRGLACEACGLEPTIDYGYRDTILNLPLDVHHAKPLSGLAEGETRRYKIPDDFLVLCPNCHRVIHSLEDPSDLRTLKRRIGFGYARLPKDRYF